MPWENQKVEPKQAEKKSELLTVANSVARGTSNLTKRELDAFYYVMSYGRIAHRVNVAGDAEILVVTVPIKDYEDALSGHGTIRINRKSVIKNMKDILTDQGVITYVDANKNIAIARCFYKVIVKTDTIDVLVDNDIAKLFWGLTANFTEAALDSLIKMRSKFSISLYLNIKSRSDRRGFSIGTKDLKTLFGLSKESYTRKDGKFDRAAFEKKTIDLAVKEINDMGDIHLAYHKDKKLIPDKDGKNALKVIGYVFEWIPKDAIKAAEEKPMGDIVAERREILSGPTGVKPTREEIRKDLFGDDGSDKDPNSYESEEYFDK
jgi:hypothetical protein